MLGRTSSWTGCESSQRGSPCLIVYAARLPRRSGLVTTAESVFKSGWARCKRSTNPFRPYVLV